jgi:hypothetical protein
MKKNTIQYKIYASLLFPIFTCVVFGQNPGQDELSDSAGLGSSVETDKTAIEVAQDILDSKPGWQEGWDFNSNRFIAIGNGTIPVPPSHRDFDQARILAFSKAMLDAKAKLAQSMGVKVSNDIAQSFSEPNIEQAFSEIQEKALSQPSALNKAKKLIHNELDDLLKERGVDPGNPKAGIEVKKLLSSEKFNKTIQATCRAEVDGLLVYQSIETMNNANDGGNVAVIVVFSKKSEQMARAILGKGDAPKAGSGKATLKEYINSLKTHQLISTFGVKPRTDEKGNLNLIAFGQSTPRTSSTSSANFARKKAGVNALGYLRSFAGEMVSGFETMDQSDSFEEFEDDMEDYAVTDTAVSITKARAEKLNIVGAFPARYWRAKDPRSGKTVVGQILVWSLGSAKNANALRDQMNSIGGSKGGAGVTARPKANNQKPTAKTKPVANDSPFTKKSVASDDDDF